MCSPAADPDALTCRSNVTEHCFQNSILCL
uniref:Uncharacterized protein n=1 Tax=Arundo donax TaxID=35708 RepID=A0A0A9CIG0_ARUDO